MNRPFIPGEIYTPFIDDGKTVGVGGGMQGHFKTSGDALLIHPAVEVVAHTLKLWDDHAANARAMLIVQRLIETGQIAGEMRADVPLVRRE